MMEYWNIGIMGPRAEAPGTCMKGGTGILPVGLGGIGILPMIHGLTAFHPSTIPIFQCALGERYGV
jgi:hypothetical protein